MVGVKFQKETYSEVRRHGWPKGSEETAMDNGLNSVQNFTF